MKNTYRIAEISFGTSNWDASYEFQFKGQHFQVQRFGTLFSVENVKSLIEKYRSEVDAFAMTALPPVIKLDHLRFAHAQYLEIMSLPSPVPMCDGRTLKEMSNLNSLISKIKNNEINPELGVYFPVALLTTEMEEYIRHLYPFSVYFGDAYSALGFPLVLRPFPGLKSLAKLSMQLASFKNLKTSTPHSETWTQKIAHSLVSQQIQNAQYIIADMAHLLLFEEGVNFIKDKDLITWSYHPLMEKEIQRFGPRKVIQLFPEEFHVSSHMNYPVMDAVFRLLNSRKEEFQPKEWEQILALDTPTIQTIRRYTSARKSSTQLKISAVLHKTKQKIMDQKPPDFAFVVHALSHKDFEKIPILGRVVQMIPEQFHEPFDKTMGKIVPPFVYGEIKHIISEKSGKEVNGLIYALASTPQVLKNESPEVTYQRILRCCYDAAGKGAKIIGLGAYTKVVGDSGFTINQQSPIPVTTGNSLSASATLWGLYDAVKRMNLLKLNSTTGHVDGAAMVIGATGSIGKVSAKLLSLAFRKLVLVAPRKDRLEDLAIEIKKMAPHCEVIISTDANELVSDVDAIVTATSAFDQKIVDVMNLKPGCIVCDCSRPLDFNLEDALKRPDVLIIESGELILPGPYHLTCDLGLPGKTVYACLAETALLSLEEKYESYTLGREIEWTKVKDIYKLCLKHGVRLASIYGHQGLISDKEIQLVKELALTKRKLVRSK